MGVALVVAGEGLAPRPPPPTPPYPTPPHAGWPLPLPSPCHPGTDQVYQLLIADLPFIIALCQGHQHVQLGGVQGQLMAVHEAGKRLHADETGVLGVKLQGEQHGHGQVASLA